MLTHAPRGVFDVLDGPVEQNATAIALVTRQGQVSYGQLDQMADRAAGALYELGLRPGDRLAVGWPNDLDILVAFHGAMRLGLMWLGISRALAAPEKAYMLADAGAQVLLGDDEVFAGLECEARPVGPDEWRQAFDAVGGSGRPGLATPDPGAPCAIAYTSGTTGFPKGAVHCQAGLLLPGAATIDRRGWGPDLRKGDSFALTILNMMTLTTLLTAQAGATSVIMDHGDVASVVDWIRRERVTVWNGAPAHLHTMVHDPEIEPATLASLQEVWVGGGDCPDSLRDAFEARFGVPVSRTYGLTEAPALVSLDDLEAPGRSADRPRGTSGRPLDHIEVTSVAGELVLGPVGSGPWSGRFRPLLEYWNRPDATAETVDGARLHTGDLGTLEPNGHLRVVGRKSQLIIRGGANVYPAEVERVLSEAPGVQACAVVGLPDERLGERVGAAIETEVGTEPNEAAIVAHCREHLARYKVPERFVFVAALPRNQMGKVPRADVVHLLTGGK